jgi:MOSC domain-containing protein
VTTAPTQEQPRLANIRLHPIKSLDPVYVNEARIGPAGGLELDRAWALYTPDNRWVNGKRTPAIFAIRANFAPDLKSVTLSVPGDTRQIPPREFAFPGDHEEAAEWFSVYFDQRIIVRNSANGFPDDPDANGPTIISTASLQKVCDWFADSNIDLEEARRRSKSMACMRSGKTAYLARRTPTRHALASARSSLRAATHALAAACHRAIRSPRQTTSDFRSASANCAVNRFLRGRRSSASIIFIGSQRTRASRSRKPAKRCASAIRS